MRYLARHYARTALYGPQDAGGVAAGVVFLALLGFLLILAF
jgi:hypothetical protein